MSKFLDRFRYFKQKGETFADGHGQLLNTNRDWEDGYRQRWQHDKIVRSTHGVNCTGSCSWKIYVKNKYIQEAISRIKEDFVKIIINEDKNKPIIVTRVDEDDYICIILIVRNLGY